MGIFGALDKDKYDRQYSDTYLLQRLWQYMSPQKGRLLAITATGLLFAFSQATVPLLIAWGVDQLETGDTGNTIALIVGALLLGIMVFYAANWVRRRLTARFIGQLVAQMRKDGFQSAVERDLEFYDKNKTGKILSRLTSDTEDFGQILVVTTDILAQLVQIVVLTVVLLYYNAVLTLVILGSLIPIAFATNIFRKQARNVTRTGARAMANVNDSIQETVTGITVAKNFRQEGSVYNDFTQSNTQSYQVNLRRGAILAGIFPVLNALAGLATAIVLYVGASAAVAGTISIGIWYLYIQSVERFWFPVINLSSYWSQFQQAISAIERVFALIDAENTVQQTDNQTAAHLKGEVVFNNVTFGYDPEQPVLPNFSLHVQPGENIAFVGHTGAGKSSIVKLIMRLYEFQGGEICIDGHDIRSFDIKSYRTQLGFVPQQPFLFTGSIRENIRYGRPDATDAEIDALANSIGAGEWLETLPDGLDSDVGERGARLSIGQRQLVSLLRVLIQNPAIFILDEATASIDQFTEMQIQEALDLVLAQSTSFLIAHRLSTVRTADRIIVLREGQIIETGSHEELMAQGGHYAELYNTYFRHQSLSYVDDARELLASGD